MDRYKEIRERLYSLAESDEKIKAMIIVGSSARTYSVADEYSDLDVIIVTEEPEAWLHGEYPARLGNIKISFIETTFTGIKERRILYEGDLDLDLVVLTPEQFMDIGVNGPGNEVLNRGYVDMITALISTHKLFSKLAGKVAGYCGYSYPDEADIYTGEYLGRNLYSAT